MNDTDTIAAISTALGNAGIHIIRISGAEAFDIIEKVFKKGKSLKDFKVLEHNSHTMHYGFIMQEKECIDEVMVSIFAAPNSYTTENVVEVNCHGGSFAVKNILKIIINAGARLALPGEFTKRAFLGGRIDLSQAESIMGIIKSENEYALKASVNHLRGNIKDEINSLRESVLYEMAFIEAALDDPEHYSLDNYSIELKDKLYLILDKLNRLSSSYNNGRIISEGIRAAIVGKPNVGKSSFMNFIMNEDKAIVTDIPGTTRDIIEHSIHLDGITLNLMDTAGIHKTKDYVESIGIEKSLKAAEDAELNICILDASRKFDEEDIYILNLLDVNNTIVLINKSDIADGLFENDIKERGFKTISFSTVTGQGYEELSDTIKNMFFDNKIDIHNETFITNIRHIEAINKAIFSLKLVLENIDNGIPEDLFTIDMMDAYNYLGEITGETVSDDLIDKIFSEFCMGK